MNIKSFLFCLSLMVSLYSCKDEVVVDAPEQPIDDVQEDGFPVIIDTVPEQLNTNYNFDGVPRANYQPYYFGDLTDSIFIGQRIRRSPPVPPPNMRGVNYKEDTSKTVWNQFDDYFFYYYANSEMEKYIIKQESIDSVTVEIDSRRKLKGCFPAFVTNTYLDTVVLGDDSNGVFAIMQAENENGLWVDVERRFRGGCGMGVSGILCPPKESILILVPIYKGEYITQLRLKLGSFYSKPFMGTINKNQFVIPD